MEKYVLSLNSEIEAFANLSVHLFRSIFLE
jgi:hypothetical protein